MTRILTIETTCDETAAAVVTDELQILGAVVASQHDLHERFGGVVPEIASRAHVERILPVIEETLREAGYSGVGIWGLDTKDRYAWTINDMDRITESFVSLSEVQN